jgi:hypothetical protein
MQEQTQQQAYDRGRTIFSPGDCLLQILTIDHLFQYSQIT